MIIKTYEERKKEFYFFKTKANELNEKYKGFFSKIKKAKNIIERIVLLGFKKEDLSEYADINFVMGVLTVFGITPLIFLKLTNDFLTSYSLNFFESILLFVSSIYVFSIITYIPLSMLTTNFLFNAILKKINKNELAEDTIKTYSNIKNIKELFSITLKSYNYKYILNEDKDIINVCKKDKCIKENILFTEFLKPALLKAYTQRKITIKNLIKKINYYISELNIEKEEVIKITNFLEKEQEYNKKIKSLESMSSNLLNLNNKKVIF